MEKLLKQRVQEALDVIRPRLSETPDVAIILGSGLGYLAESLTDSIQLESSEIPYYPRSTVPGHQGRWIIGKLGSVCVLAIQGRAHFYEGYSLDQVTFPVHLVASLGVKKLIVTTSSGGLNPDFRAGDIMLIRDHINLGFSNPLIGNPENQLGPRFPDMSQAYDKEIVSFAKLVAGQQSLEVKEGVFCWVTGPNYETAAEVRMLRALGGDAVSMSTVPEVIVAIQRHLKVLGISLITNQATGLKSEPLSHEEVTAVAAKAAQRLGDYLVTILKGIKNV